MAAKNQTKKRPESPVIGRPRKAKTVTSKNVTLEEADIAALDTLATIAQNHHIKHTGKQNPGIGHSWVIRALIRNATREFSDYDLGDDHASPGLFFGISGDVESK